MSAPPIHHVAVEVADLARAEAFYAGVLGLPIVRRWNDEAGQPRSLWLGLGGGAFFAIEKATGAKALAGRREDGTPGWHCVALAIAPGERRAWRDRLAAAGHPAERESDFTLYTRDPDGNLVALSHYPEPPG